MALNPLGGDEVRLDSGALDVLDAVALRVAFIFDSIDFPAVLPDNVSNSCVGIIQGIMDFLSRRSSMVVQPCTST